jgi:hypothetical protein
MRNEEKQGNHFRHLGQKCILDKILIITKEMRGQTEKYLVHKIHSKMSNFGENGHPFQTN